MYGDDGNDVLGDVDHYTQDREYSDTFYGGAGDDYFRRTDEFRGEPPTESDTFYGGEGDDLFILLVNRSKGDLVYGGDGKDWFNLGPVVGSRKHRIYCGSGYDTVEYSGQDRRDLVTHDCERVRLGS